MKQRGFALVIVLWSLVLLSLIMTRLVAAGRTETRIATNLVANAEAEAVADGAVWETVFRLEDGSDARWPMGSAAHVLRFPRAEATVRIVPEDGKINPNTASLEIMTALLMECGADAAKADSLAQAILDWRDPGEQPRPRGGKMAQYRDAGLDYGPPDAAFESLDELRRVLGMTEDIFQRLRPHLSLYQSGEPDQSEADPIVEAALRRLNIRPAPNAAAAVRSKRIVSLSVDAETENGGHFSRHAIIQITAAPQSSYAVLAWDKETDPERSY